MASLTAERPDDGYATPLAMAICLALTLGVGALASTSASELKLARRDLTKMQAEYALAGLQAEATLRLIESGSPDAMRWTYDTQMGEAEVLAEPEADKLTPAAASEDERLLALLGAPEGPLWRRCARSVISAYGVASERDLALPQAPDKSGPSWRAGQVWRVRVSAGGWRDDRVVRFTGSARMPAAVVEREFGRGENLGAECDAISRAG